MTTAIAPRSIVDRIAPAGVTQSMAGNAALVILGALVVGISAQVRIPLGFTPVPLTGQTFGVLLVGASLGASRGGAALVLYLLLGVIGFPVFTEGGRGVQHVLGATGGYLIGFIAAAVLVGRIAERGGDRRFPAALAGMAAGSMVIYAFGLIGLMVALGVGPGRALELGLYPFLVGDLLKALLAGLLLPIAWWLVRRVDRDE